MTLRTALVLVLVLAACLALPRAGSANEFPFEHELHLDARPMAGSKRIPGMEVMANGRGTIDLWCASGPAQVVVAGDTITIIAGQMAGLPNDPACTPERAQADAAVLDAITQATNWRREADVVTLIGPTPLRFHISSH